MTNAVVGRNVEEFNPSTAPIANPTYILDFAREAQAALWTKLDGAFGLTTPPLGTTMIAKSIIPSVLHVDNFGTFATDIALWLDQKLEP